MLQEIAAIVQGLVGNDYLYFETPVRGEVGLLTTFSIWAICASPKDEVFVMDSDEQWHQLSGEDITVAEIYKKVKQIEIQYKNASNS